MGVEGSGTDSHAVGEVVTTRSGWWAGAAAIAVFASGFWVGAIVYSAESSDGSRSSTVEATAIGCRSELVLVVDAENMPDDAYELRVSVRDRMVPMTHEEAYALVGRQHPRSVEPVDGGLLLVVAVPTESDFPIRHGLVGRDTDFAVGGTLLPRSNLQACADSE